MQKAAVPRLFIMALTSISSTKNISPELLQAIADAIKDKYYGSVEIYIQDYQVTQISERVIRKINDKQDLANDKE